MPILSNAPKFNFTKSIFKSKSSSSFLYGVSVENCIMLSTNSIFVNSGLLLFGVLLFGIFDKFLLIVSKIVFNCVSLSELLRFLICSLSKLGAAIKRDRIEIFAVIFSIFNKSKFEGWLIDILSIEIESGMISRLSCS